MPAKLLKFINKERIMQYGKNTNTFSKRYHKESKFFIVKEKMNVIAWGFLRPIEMTYSGKKYNIFALGGIMVIKGKEGKGYGTFLIQNMVKWLKKKNKTGVGFCGKKTSIFYKKAGLKVKQDFSPRIEMENPKTGKRIQDPDVCPGIYIEGKDKFVSKVGKGKGIATYWMPDIKEPHF